MPTTLKPCPDSSAPLRTPRVEAVLREVIAEVIKHCESAARVALYGRDEIAAAATMETLLQTAYLIADDRLKLDQNYRAYIRRIARRKVVDEIRKQVSLAHRFPRSAVEPRDVPDRNEANQPLKRAMMDDTLNQLHSCFDARDVVAFVLRHRDGVTFEEIARDLGYRNPPAADRAIKKIDAYLARR